MIGCSDLFRVAGGDYKIYDAFQTALLACGHHYHINYDAWFSSDELKDMAMAKHGKPNTGKNPSAKGDGIKAAQANQGRKPSNLTGMAAAKKKER